MQVFKTEEFQKCAYSLSVSENPSDAFRAWASLEGNFPDFVGMVCLSEYERRSLPQAIKKYTQGALNYLVPYFDNDKVYFLNDKIFIEMFDKNRLEFPVDYTVMFDSNISSYINKLIRMEPLNNIPKDFLFVIDEILRDDLNFDFLFYLFENGKGLSDIRPFLNRSKVEFWRSLDKKFRQNMVSLQLFRSIDGKKYKKTLSPVPEFTYRRAAREAIEFAYDFYVGKQGGNASLEQVKLLQRVMLLSVIGMIKIQLSSNRSHEHKINEWFRFVVDVIGVYFARETYVAHRYFLDRNNVGIIATFQKVGAGGKFPKKLLKKLDNIAWDFLIPRFMENLICKYGCADGGAKNNYIIPTFMTFDRNLKQLLSLFPIKAVVYDNVNGTLVPIPMINVESYFKGQGCSNEFDSFCNELNNRQNIEKSLHTMNSLRVAIKNEYRKLRHIMNGV